MFSSQRNATEKEDTESLCFLTKSDDGWVINELARLPEVDHGDLPDSVKVDTLQVENDLYVSGEISASGIKVGDSYALTLDVVSAGDKYQLKFSYLKPPEEN